MPAAISGRGREEDRADATCQFCDTDFVGTDGPGGGKFATPRRLPRACRAAWRGNSRDAAFVVLTGGEPMLQVDEALIDALHARGFEIAIETNGTLPVPRAHRLDLRQPQGRRAARAALGRRTEARLSAGRRSTRKRSPALDFTHFLLAADGRPRAASQHRAAIAYCLAHPDWRLSLQTHKLLGMR